MYVNPNWTKTSLPGLYFDMKFFENNKWKVIRKLIKKGALGIPKTWDKNKKSGILNTIFDKSRGIDGEKLVQTPITEEILIEMVKEGTLYSLVLLRAKYDIVPKGQTGIALQWSFTFEKQSENETIDLYVFSPLKGTIFYMSTKCTTS